MPTDADDAAEGRLYGREPDRENEPEAVRESMKEAIEEADAAMLVTFPDIEGDPEGSHLWAFVDEEHEGDRAPDPYKVLYEQGTRHIASRGGDAAHFGAVSAVGGRFSSSRGYRPIEADLRGKDDDAEEGDA